MKKTILAEIIVDNTYNQDTAKYLKEKWGMPLRGLAKEAGGDSNTEPQINIVEIEIRDYPSIMSKVEKAGYFSDHVGWIVNKVSEDGISFYLDSYSGKSEDGEHTVWQQAFILVPMANIIAIHDVSEQLFIDLSVKSVEASEKKNVSRRKK